MTVPVLLGASAGLGLALLVVWIAPPKPELGPLLARLATRSTVPVDDITHRRLLGPAIRLLQTAGLPNRRLARDLEVLDRPTVDHLAQKAVLALTGLLVPAIAALAATALGTEVGIRVPGSAAVVGVVCGFLVPDHRARKAAAERRRDFRHALSAFLDLVVISLAGGAGVDSALTNAAATGRGWAFTRLRSTLAAARLTRTTPWAALGRLGCELDIPDLTELAASVALAGTEGATVRTSLQAKASAIRTRQLTDSESDASADTERMSLPVMGLFFGFLCFITYPAMTQVLAAF